MAEAPRFETGQEIADYIRPHDDSLADLVEMEEWLHDIAVEHPFFDTVVTRFVNDLGIPGRYQTETYARGIIRNAAPDMPEEKFEAEVAVRMARANRYGKDPARVFVTERVLGLEIPDAEACWGGLLRLTQSDQYNISCRILPDTLFDVGSRGQLAAFHRRALVMPGPYAFYVEPKKMPIGLVDARKLAAKAESLALSVEESVHLIEQRIS